MQFFKDANGQLSSKRLFGIACLIQAIILSYVTSDVGMVSIWLGTGAVVFGVQAVTKT